MLKAKIHNLKSWTPYQVSIFQSSYNEICISLKNDLYHDPTIIQFTFPVKKYNGIAFKCNAASVGCDTGKAEDIIKFFSTWPGSEYLQAAINKLIFEHPKKRCTPGL